MNANCISTYDTWHRDRRNSIVMFASAEFGARGLKCGSMVWKEGRDGEHRFGEKLSLHLLRGKSADRISIGGRASSWRAFNVSRVAHHHSAF